MLAPNTCFQYAVGIKCSEGICFLESPLNNSVTVDIDIFYSLSYFQCKMNPVCDSIRQSASYILPVSCTRDNTATALK
jgi:hypothetical protein